MFKKKSPHAFWSIFGPETPLFSLNLHLKILYLFPYFRTKRPALFVIYRDKIYHLKEDLMSFPLMYNF